jgi:hypothetical protein
MKTDAVGGTSANDRANDHLEERLSSRFTVELRRAERDYPNLRSRQLDTAVGIGERGRSWPRLLSAVVAVAVLAVAGLIGAGLAFRPGAGPAGPGGPSSVATGNGEIPSQIDGERVYRVTDQAEWQNLSGSFLLAGYVFREMASCPVQSAAPPPELDLIPQCGGLGLGPAAGSDATSGGLKVATLGSTELGGWIDQSGFGPAIVARVHTHDAEAAQCASADQADCQASIVVEAVVWPAVPTQIGGERVYRAADQASFPTAGSFLLGGRVTKPDLMPPCPMPLDKTAAEQQLLPYCYWVTLDGLALSPMSNFDEPKNEVLVARVHINDPLAAQCPATTQSDCEAAIVVEAVVWRSSPYGTASPTPVGETPAASLNAASTEGTGPVASESAGVVPTIVPPPPVGPSVSAEPTSADGVPTSIKGAKVYRASNLPTLGSFQFGGVLGRDTSCPAPTPTLGPPPDCGYWTIDGVKVGTAAMLSDSQIGGLVVADVTVSRTMATCVAAPCKTIVSYIVTGIVWTGQSALPTPIEVSGPSFASGSSTGSSSGSSSGSTAPATVPPTTAQPQGT